MDFKGNELEEVDLRKGHTELTCEERSRLWMQVWESFFPRGVAKTMAVGWNLERPRAEAHP